MQLHPMLADGAVLPAGKALCISGSGTGAVRVEFAGRITRGVCKNGEFRVFLPSMTYGGPYELTVTDEVGSVTCRDVYVGEVYLIAGQSNMQFKLRESSFPQEEYFTDPLLRTFSTARPEIGERFCPDDGWVQATPDTIADLTAVGILMGMELRRRKDVAIGLITCYQGASIIESWMPERLANQPEFRLDVRDKHTDHFYAQWNNAGYLYDYYFTPIIPYPLTGVAWYQGESDAAEAEARIYRDELCAMIDAWRSDLLDPELPFAVVQIADFDGNQSAGWKMIQQAQMDVNDPERRIYTVICRDVCEKDQIHPPTKLPLARRLADVFC